VAVPLPFVLLVGVLPSMASLAGDYSAGRWPFAPDEWWLEKLPYWVGLHLSYLLIGFAIGCGFYVINDRLDRKRMGDI
jgi:hypothetical protein